MKPLFISIIFVLLSACSSSGKKTPDKLYYRFPEPTQMPFQQKRVTSKRPSAMGILGNRPMVAQNKDGSLIQMQHNFWLESPKILLHQYLNKIFINDASQASHILNTHILHLEKQQQTAILEIAFTMIDDQRQPVFSKSYYREQNLTENSIPAFVSAISSMLQNMVDELLKDIS